MKTSVWCTTEFAGFHCWPEAPEEVSYLREMHRHVFKIRVDVEVHGVGRDIEFITLKKHVDEVIDRECLTHKTIDWSCEQWALEIMGKLMAAYGYRVRRVEVSEDGENGATIEWQRD